RPPAPAAMRALRDRRHQSPPQPPQPPPPPPQLLPELLPQLDPPLLPSACVCDARGNILRTSGKIFAGSAPNPNKAASHTASVSTPPGLSDFARPLSAANNTR